MKKIKGVGNKKPKTTDWEKYIPKAGPGCIDIEKNLQLCPIEERLHKYKGIYHKMHTGDISYPLHKVMAQHFGYDYFEVMKDPEVQREISNPLYRRPLPHVDAEENKENNN